MKIDWRTTIKETAIVLGILFAGTFGLAVVGIFILGLSPKEMTAFGGVGALALIRFLDKKYGTPHKTKKQKARERLRTVTWRFQINGTDASQPFGSLAQYPQNDRPELAGHDLALQSLSEPSMTPSEIRRRLKPYFNENFIAFVVQHYRPNEIVNCAITCDWQ